MKKCPACQSSRFRQNNEGKRCDNCGYTNIPENKRKYIKIDNRKI